jgi:ubiquinone/menaquinone biosynthesis C-methylase UbiE
MCEAAKIVPGQRVLDIASGVGVPSIVIASRVMPNGHVTATDLSPEMLAVAEHRAAAAGRTNMDFRVMNAEAIDLPDASCDAVTCSYGIMFSAEPARALAEIHRVLRAGGRAAFAVWDEPARNPFFSAIGPCVGEILQPPPPDPKAPGQFRFAKVDELVELLRDAGFADARAERVGSSFQCESPEQYWQILTDHAAALRLLVAERPAETQQRFREAVLEAVKGFATKAGLRFEAWSWGVTAAK